MIDLGDAEVREITYDSKYYVTIVTDVGEISWAFQKESRCCEKAGIEWKNRDFVGRKIKRIHFENEGHWACLKFELNDILDHIKNHIENNNCLTKEDLNNMLEKDVIEVIFTNRHNGYYPHNLTIYIDGHEKWNVAL